MLGKSSGFVEVTNVLDLGTHLAWHLERLECSVRLRVGGSLLAHTAVINACNKAVLQE